MVQPPCKDCENRAVGCHSECKLYKKYKDELTAVWYYKKRIKAPGVCASELKNNLYEKYKKRVRR